jgi:hypothetical protein
MHHDGTEIETSAPKRNKQAARTQVQVVAQIQVVATNRTVVPAKKTERVFWKDAT